MPKDSGQNGNGNNGHVKGKAKKSSAVKNGYSEQQLAVIKERMVSYSRKLDYSPKEAERIGQLAIEVLTTPSDK